MHLLLKGYAVAPGILAILAFVEDRFVIDAVLKLAVKNEALEFKVFQIHAFVVERVVKYAVPRDILTILAFVEDKFVIDAVLKLAAKNEALLPDKL